MGWQSPFSFFTDSILRAPTIGSMLMCLAAGLVGTLIFLRKESLIGEALSHAAYPGVMLGVFFSGVLLINQYEGMTFSLLILGGAFFSSILGLWIIHLMKTKLKVKSDTALCFVLSAFFGIGLTIASQLQFSYTSLYKQAQVYLYGQAATMTDIHIAIYGLLSLVILGVLTLLYKELQVLIFDREYAEVIGIQRNWIESILFILIVLAVIIGIRSVGVVLMSAMLIAPPVAARQFTNRLPVLFFLSALFGVTSGFFGNYLSVELTRLLTWHYPSVRLALPTGPMIVVVASTICLVSLLFAPERGLLLRLYRIVVFRYRCVCENILKGIWRIDPKAPVLFQQIAKYQDVSPLYLKAVLWHLRYQGWIEDVEGGKYQLTHEGELHAANVVRLHRLWEVYLVDYVGIGPEKVHRNAEEMEHIITPALERELTLLLKNPKKDPHQQPIPSKESL